MCEQFWVLIQNAMRGCTLHFELHSGYTFRMAQFYSKTCGFALLLTFVMTTLFSLPGFAWCVGEDGHIEVELSVSGDCAGKAFRPSTHSATADASSVYFAAEFDAEHCGPCNDFYFQAHEVISASRHDKTPPSPGLHALDSLIALTYKNNIQPERSFAPVSPQRISQAILSHQTVVLLI